MDHLLSKEQEDVLFCLVLSVLYGNKEGLKEEIIEN